MQSVLLSKVIKKNLNRFSGFHLRNLLNSKKDPKTGASLFIRE